MENRKSTLIVLGTSVGVGLAYGVAARILFANDLGELGGGLLGVMTMSFIFVVPVVVGFVTVYFGPPHLRTRIPYALFMPWVTAALTMGALMATALEGAICIVMMLPVFLLMATVGGAMALGVRQSERRRGRMNVAAVGAVLLLPYLAAPVENALPAAMQHRVVENQIRIQAGAGDVWRQIVRVPPIDPNQYGTSFVHRIGFPRPVEATLSREGVGGVRHASFERGVVFVETVTTWQPQRVLSFTIRADPATIPPTTFDQHVTVGGEFFDVLDGTYEIEPVGENEVILHLRSTHRLSTTFNFYASFWTDLVMRQIQGNILEIVKSRSEAAA